ncbi:MAG TPA: murein biosynthesis integral membrane protein MurJ [Blastocatellia bacterium]|nr:murein biosynthesis integral membrane protein MurJ [Blastocatellia bacterium]
MSDVEPETEPSFSSLDKDNAGDAADATRRPKARSHSVVRSAGIVSVAVMLSRLLGLVREVVFAGLFGASRSFANDAFVIAFRIPNLLRDLFAEGALSGAFVTVFSDYQVTKSEKEAFRLSNLVVTMLSLVLGVLVVLGIIFAPQIVGVIAAGYRGDPDKFALTVELTRIMMPFILLVALAAQAMGVLNARDRFAVPALSSSFFNLGSIAGGVLFAVLLTDPTFSHPVQSIHESPARAIIGMAYGVLIGGFLQYALQWPSLWRAGFRYRPMLSLRDEGVRRILRLMGPAVIGGAAVQINFMVNGYFATTIPGNGPVVWLNCAFRLMQFPIGVFGVAIATATTPSISKSAALAEIGDFRKTLARSIRMTFMLTIPSAVGLGVLARPIIALIYEHGVFTSRDTDHTADALAFYALGLAGYSAIKILLPGFYALRDARTPMMVSLLSIFTNLGMNWSLVGTFHERGLALSVSTVALVNFALLYALMRRRIGRIEGKETAAGVGKILLASAVMGAFCWAVNSVLGRISLNLGSRMISRLFTVLVSVGVGSVVFYIAASLLRIPELKEATTVLTRRFSRRR